jgi:uncharacterized protein (TIGR02147 family)
MMKRAAESIDRFPRDKREISSLTFGVSEAAARKIKDKIQKFRKELVEVISDDNPATAVYQMNFQLFPLIDSIAGKKEDEND